jgi:dienelactone hydrolase
MSLTEEDKQWTADNIASVGASERRLTALICESVVASESRLAAHIAETAQAVEDRTAALIAAELGGLHSDMQEIDRRLKRVDGNTITTMELLTMQSRWHEESDNAVRMLTSQQTEFAHKLEDLRARVDKLEHRPH